MRHDDQKPTHDDCGTCGLDFYRGDLHFGPDMELECEICRHRRVQRAAAQSMADQGYTVSCQGQTYSPKP